jgi:hypothetical protein
MTNEEKITSLAELISPDTADVKILSQMIAPSEGIVLNRRYPLGVPQGAIVPKQYEHIQLQIALELFAKRGAEGQTEHDENGIARKYESADISPTLLRRITPILGSVTV